MCWSLIIFVHLNKDLYLKYSYKKKKPKISILLKVEFFTSYYFIIICKFQDVIMVVTTAEETGILTKMKDLTSIIFEEDQSPSACPMMDEGLSLRLMADFHQVLPHLIFHHRHWELNNSILLLPLRSNTNDLQWPWWVFMINSK